LSPRTVKLPATAPRSKMLCVARDGEGGKRGRSKVRSGDAKGAHASEGVCFGPSVHAPVPPYASSVHATCAPTVFPPAYLPLPSATVHPPAGPLAPLSRWTFSIASLLSRAVSGTVKSRRMCLPNARGRGANCPACPLGASRAASLPPASPPLALVLTATDPATGSRFHSAHSHGRRFAARAHALHARTRCTRPGTGFAARS